MASKKIKEMCYAFQKAGNVHKIYLYDDVSRYGEFNWQTWDYDESETSAAYFSKMLNEIPETDSIELYINSNGGDAAQGTAIFNQLKRHGAYKTGIVDGVAHSIAFTIFQACDKRIMGEGTSAIIHDMWGSCSGNAEDHRKYAENLDVWMDSCVALLMNRAQNITEDELREMMHKETMLSPQKAIEYGFCDEIGSKAEETADIVQILTNENENLKQQIRNGNAFQKQLVEFYQLTHDESQIRNDDGTEVVHQDIPAVQEHTGQKENEDVNQKTGFACLFN